MTRPEEAVLALIGSAETSGKAWLATDFSGDNHVQSLLSEGMAEVVNGNLLVSIRGWRFLDGRPKSTSM
jgi:hypothetical protein